MGDYSYSYQDAPPFAQQGSADGLYQGLPPVPEEDILNQYKVGQARLRSQLRTLEALQKPGYGQAPAQLALQAVLAQQELHILQLQAQVNMQTHLPLQHQQQQLQQEQEFVRQDVKREHLQHDDERPTKRPRRGASAAQQQQSAQQQQQQQQQHHQQQQSTVERYGDESSRRNNGDGNQISVDRTIDQAYVGTSATVNRENFKRSDLEKITVALLQRQRYAWSTWAPVEDGTYIRIHSKVGKWLHIRIRGPTPTSPVPPCRNLRLIKLPERGFSEDLFTRGETVGPVCPTEVHREHAPGGETYVEFRFKLAKPVHRMVFAVDILGQNGAIRTLRTTAFGSRTSGAKAKGLANPQPLGVGPPTPVLTRLEDDDTSQVVESRGSTSSSALPLLVPNDDDDAESGSGRNPTMNEAAQAIGSFEGDMLGGPAVMDPAKRPVPVSDMAMHHSAASIAAESSGFTASTDSALPTFPTDWTQSRGPTRHQLSGERKEAIEWASTLFN